VGGSRLTDLQQRVLVLLAGLELPWTLVGGGALVGFHFGHRTTRDLDLFFRPCDGLGSLGEQARDRLRKDGLSVGELRNTRDFVRLGVSSDDEMVVVDLVSERTAPPREPEEARIGEATIRIASRLELLASKLCTLMSRAEIRDIVDVRILLENETDLDSGLAVAPSVDTGFSPSTLAWVLRDLDVLKLAVATGLAQEEARELASFKNVLISRLVEAARPR
jgi:hypothetical protein